MTPLTRGVAAVIAGVLTVTAVGTPAQGGAIARGGTGTSNSLT